MAQTTHLTGCCHTKNTHMHMVQTELLVRSKRDLDRANQTIAQLSDEQHRHAPRPSLYFSPPSFLPPHLTVFALHKLCPLSHKHKHTPHYTPQIHRKHRVDEEAAGRKTRWPCGSQQWRPVRSLRRQSQFVWGVHRGCHKTREVRKFGSLGQGLGC